MDGLPGEAGVAGPVALTAAAPTTALTRCRHCLPAVSFSMNRVDNGTATTSN